MALHEVSLAVDRIILGVTRGITQASLSSCEYNLVQRFDEQLRLGLLIGFELNYQEMAIFFWGRHTLAHLKEILIV